MTNSPFAGIIQKKVLKTYNTRYFKNIYNFNRIYTNEL